MNITSINLLIRFNKTREIFRCGTLDLSILLTEATNLSVERANSKERLPKVPGSSPAAIYTQK